MAVVRRKVRYYTPRRNNRGFWEPPKWAREIGFSSIACGPDGPDAWAIAEKWNEKLDAARLDPTEGERLKAVHGSLGHWFYTWKTLEDFARKKTATRTEYNTAWNHIEPILGDKSIDDINSDDVMAFQIHLEKTTSERVRWGTIRILMSILRAAKKRQVIDTLPEQILTNPMPKPRTEIWFPQELELLKANAVEVGLPEIGLAIWLAQETALSPVDIRTLTPNMLRTDAEGPYLCRDRTKTGRQAQPALNQALYDALLAYIASLPFELTPDSIILRRASTGKPWKDPPEMAKDFRKVRNSLWPDEKRRLMDIRRSVSFYADLGGATPDERGALLANNIGTDENLNATYSPHNVVKSRQTAKRREMGETIMRQLYTARQQRSEKG